jgi:hypothetical protein
MQQAILPTQVQDNPAGEKNERHDSPVKRGLCARHNKQQAIANNAE